MLETKAMGTKHLISVSILEAIEEKKQVVNATRIENTGGNRTDKKAV